MTSLNLVAASHEDPGAEEELGEPPQLGTAHQLTGSQFNGNINMGLRRLGKKLRLGFTRSPPAKRLL